MAASKVVSRAALRAAIAIVFIYALLVCFKAFGKPDSGPPRSLISLRDRRWNITSTFTVQDPQRPLNAAVAVSSHKHSTKLRTSEEDEVPTTHPELQWKESAYNDTSHSIQHFIRTNNLITTPPSLLILTMTRDASSWGTQPDSTPRDLLSFLDMLASQSLTPSTLSLTILTSSATEYDLYRTLTSHHFFARLHFILHPGYQSTEGERGARHDNSIQHDRRAEMAKLRNYAMLTSLQQEDNLLWFDADIYALTPSLIATMLGKMSHEKVGILTVRSTLGEDDDSDYDLNAWKGGRTRPNEEERDRLRRDKGSWVANRGEGNNKQMGDLVREREEDLAGAVDEKGVFDPQKARFEDVWAGDVDQDGFGEGGDGVEGCVKLDAVGATVLMTKASVVRQGVVFSMGYMVGLDWGDEGWDAIESEGLCVLARMVGVGCYGLVERRWWSRHSTG